MVQQDGKNALELSPVGKNKFVSGPFAACGPDDVIILKLRTRGPVIFTGCFFYDEKGKISARKLIRTPDTGKQNEYVIPVPELKKRNISGFRVILTAPSEGKAVIDQLEVQVAPKLNLPKADGAAK